MAKKTSVKVRLVPENKPDSPFFYYVKKPSGGEKAKIKLNQSISHHQSIHRNNRFQRAKTHRNVI